MDKLDTLKLRELAPVLRSSTGLIQMAIVYDIDTGTDIESGCSIDYAVKNYGDWYLDRITAEESDIVLHVRKEI